VRDAACPRAEGSGVEAVSETVGSGSRRGPTLSEMHSETSTPRIIKILAADNLVVSAPLAI
jgi:hypothetical protein